MTAPSKSAEGYLNISANGEMTTSSKIEQEICLKSQECRMLARARSELHQLTRQFMKINGQQTVPLLIPKLIHQTTHERPWPKCWEICHATWKRDYPEPEYTHKLWSDADLLSLVSTEYPEFLECYESLPSSIQKVDVARYLILHKHGGIYVDMDYESFKNIYLCLAQGKINVVESPYVENETYQNSLMASEPSRDFWYVTVREAVKRANTSRRLDVMWTTGPTLMDDMCQRREKHVHPLASCLFQPSFQRVFCDHRQTGVWWKKKNPELHTANLERAARDM